MTKLVWYRNDLRCHFHQGLQHALASGEAVRAVYLDCPQQWHDHGIAPLRQRYVLRALLSLGDNLAALGVPLDVIDCGRFSRVADVLASHADTHDVDEIFCTREYPFNEMARDRAVAKVMAQRSVAITAFDDAVLVPPRTLTTGQGGWYSVFTPYRKRWQVWLAENPPPGDGLDASPRKKSGRFPGREYLQARLAETEHLAGHDRQWPADEATVREELARFIDEHLAGYKRDRDFPALDGTSGLSAALSTGVLAAAECYRRAEDEMARRPAAKEGGNTWVGELAWRDFYRQIMANHPRLATGEPYRDETRFIQWSRDEALYQAWCEGRTGYPLVDAAMRQLRQTGWMHNRLRMVTAMFLTKNLFIDWRWGEQWFMQHLVDGDFAANNGGWQWSASTGTDAAPYFRVFNPVRQGERFDPEGDFIRRYVPELAQLEGKAVHQPWKSPMLCPDYPQPVVSLDGVRDKVVSAFQAARDIAQQKDFA
jgi:deoxyribodipyrimidine photo-lyase